MAPNANKPLFNLWSDCSRERFRDTYEEYKDNWCMEEKPDACCYKADLNSEAFKHLGCFSEDPNNPSVPIMLGQKHSGTFTAQECYELAAIYRESYPIFGIRDYECWAALNKQTYNSKGNSTKCNCQRGALNSISAFEVVGRGTFNVEDLGCWTDTKDDRAFGKLLKYAPLEGMKKEECLAIVREENAKMKANGKEEHELYALFAVQDHRECWASEESNNYKKHDKSNQCLGKGPIWGGNGGNWAGNVYKLKSHVPKGWWID